MNAAILGYGKMGKEIEKILLDRGHNVALVIDIDNPGDLNTANLKAKNIDVAIEFSSPSAAEKNVMTCLEAGVGVVSGSTGWMDGVEKAKAFCEKNGGAFFYASNYSVGVNILFRVNEMLARMMDGFPEYDVTVEEVHHTQKLDSPSGTAITIAEGIIGNLERKNKWVGETTTTPGELEVLGIRRSVVPGIHTITYESPIDYITVTHSVKNRVGLAYGAVMAAEFLNGKKGVYGMSDLLGF